MLTLHSNLGTIVKNFGQWKSHVDNDALIHIYGIFQYCLCSVTPSPSVLRTRNQIILATPEHLGFLDIRLNQRTGKYKIKAKIFTFGGLIQICLRVPIILFIIVKKVWF